MLPLVLAELCTMTLVTSVIDFIMSVLWRFFLMAEKSPCHKNFKWTKISLKPSLLIQAASQRPQQTPKNVKSSLEHSQQENKVPKTAEEKITWSTQWKWLSFIHTYPLHFHLWQHHFPKASSLRQQLRQQRKNQLQHFLQQHQVQLLQQLEEEFALSPCLPGRWELLPLNTKQKHLE